MRKSIIAVIASLLMGFVGLVTGVFLDETFGGSTFQITPCLTIIFVVLTMGAFIIYYNENRK